MHNKKYKEKFEQKLTKIDKIVKKTFDFRWVIQITIIAFLITLLFSSTSEIIINRVNVFLGFAIIVFFIAVGVVFDMVGIAVASANQRPFHSMGSKKISGAKMAINLIKNAEKVSAFCNDVIGDICNIMSGSAGIVIAVSLSTQYNLEVLKVTLIMTALIAATTIGGKAMGKSLAINKSEVIVFKFAKIIETFCR
jgi:CBS domain containing-hemolysin-like protein